MHVSIIRAISKGIALLVDLKLFPQEPCVRGLGEFRGPPTLMQEAIRLGSEAAHPRPAALEHSRAFDGGQHSSKNPETAFLFNVLRRGLTQLLWLVAVRSPSHQAQLIKPHLLGHTALLHGDERLS